MEPEEKEAAAGALMEGRGQLVLEVACWFVLFALIGVITYYRLRTRYTRERGFRLLSVVRVFGTTGWVN